MWKLRICRCQDTRAPATVVIHVALDEKGWIDRRVHQTAVVFPGDRIQWTYAGNREHVRLTVSDFTQIVDLGGIAELGGDSLKTAEGEEVTTDDRHREATGVQTWHVNTITEGDNLRREVDRALTREVDRAQLRPSREALMRGAQAGPEASPRGIFDEVQVGPRYVTPKEAGAACLQETEVDWKLWPFSAHWLPPMTPVGPGDRHLTSTPIKSFKGHWLWKYRWVVQVGDGAATTGCPHIYMHEIDRDSGI